MIAPLEDDQARGLLLGRWSDLAVHDLPKPVQRVALSGTVSWQTIVEALTTPRAVTTASETYVEGIRSRLAGRWGTRDAAITLARAGLVGDEIPTLEELGRDWGLTRERIRQLVRSFDSEAAAELHWRAPLRLAFGAWFALHPRLPLSVDELGDPDTPQGRAIRLALANLDVFQIDRPDSLWVETSAQQRAAEALVEALPELLLEANSVDALAERAGERLPHIEDALDLAGTLGLLAERLDFGPTPDGRLACGHNALLRRTANKIVTYLQRRAAPISASDLAHTVRKGVPPFERLHRPLVGPDWLIECARGNPDLLQVAATGEIALARERAHLRPTGTIGILHAIVVEHGEPMRMLDLCDRAREFGMSRNQVGVLIHSGRAACLFMLDRGIVGLAGRDEGTDPSEYEAARPGRRPRVRLGFDAQARIATDIEVRRSIREQGFGLPWPFSILYFSDRPELVLDGTPRQIAVRANGDLDLPELEPGTVVRLGLTATRRGHRVSIETRLTDTITAPPEYSKGARVPIGLQTRNDRPGWVEHVLEAASGQHPSSNTLLELMPRAMAPKRRLRALYAFFALGLVEPTKRGLRIDGGRFLPRALAEAFALACNDPSSYAVLPPKQQAAMGWLVQGTWLVPNVGWVRVRLNDLADGGDEDDDTTEATHATTNPRETALMRIVEAAHQADDLRRHPGENLDADVTRTIVRRYLTALGYTAYNSVRDLDASTNGSRLISVSPDNDAAPTSVWLLRPIGAGVDEQDVRRARTSARKQRVKRAVATDGLRLLAAEDGNTLDIDLRKIGRHKQQFDRLIKLALDPTALAGDREPDL